MIDRKYVGLEDIIGIRLECNCGVAVEGNLRPLQAFSNVCPACTGSRATGEENDYEKASNISAINTFLNQLDVFQKRMKDSKQSFSFQVKHDADKKETGGK